MKHILIIIFSFVFSGFFAQIIYTDLNPDAVIPATGSFPSTFGSLTIDIDNNGIVDFELTKQQQWADIRATLIPKNNNKYVCNGTKIDSLSFMSPIDSSRNFCSVNSDLMWCSLSNTTTCYWLNVKNKFIGVTINTLSGIKYGWILMRTFSTVAAYAYNNSPNQPINAGEGIPYTANYVTASDNSNFGDGRDLRVKFEKAYFENKIDHYRLLVVPSINVSSFNLDSAKSTSTLNSIVIPIANKNIDTTLNSSSKDVYGNPIKSLVNYKVLVVSYPNLANASDTLMSYYSNAVFLKNQVGVVSTPTVSSNIISANQYSVSISFNPPSSENGILHYRLYFIEAKDSTSFKLDSTNAVSSSNYQVAPPTGTTQTLSFNSVNLLTVKGNTLEPFKKYKVKIMAYTDSVNSNFSSLSSASNSFTVFTQTEAVKSIIIEDINDSSTISDIRVSFNKANNESQISEYRIIFVPKSDHPFFNIDSANITTNYVGVVPNGNNQSFVLPLSTLDYHGNSILESNTYFAYVLSKCNFVTSDANQLSSISKYFAYNTPNHFVAGQTQGSNVFYRDINDTTFASVYHISDADYYMDIDNNGIFDLHFICHQVVSATSSSWLETKVYPLNNTQVDVSYAGSGQVANHDSLDMIYEGRNWSSNLSFFNYSYNYTIPGYISSSGGLWNSTDKKHMAVRLINNDTTYAWIKMSVPSYTCISIHSYALYKKGYSSTNIQWDVFNHNYRYNYKYDNSSLISNVLFTDSVKVNGSDTIYYMNRIGVECTGSCPTVTTAITTTNTVIVPNMPQFLQRKITKYASGLVVLSDTAKLVIKSNCSLGETWIFDTINNKTAQCIAISTPTIFATTDSLKTILIGGTDTLKLSKNFSIIQFPDLYNKNKYYRLIGIENAASYDQAALYGMKVPNAWDFYNFDVGDVFCHTISRSSVTGASTSNSSYAVEKTEILFKNVTNTSYSYTVQVSAHVTNQQTVITNTYTTYDTVYTKVLIYNPLQNINSSGHIENSYPGQFIEGYPFQMLGAKGHNIVKYGLDDKGKFYKFFSSNCSDYNNIILPNKNEGDSYVIGNGYYYSNGTKFKSLYGVDLGCITDVEYYNWDRKEICMVYAKKNGTTYFGTECVLDVGIKEPNLQNQDIEIYPNPANNEVIINSKGNKISKIELTNNLGQIVLSKQINDLKTTFNLAYYSNGVYFLKIYLESNYLVKKLLIEH